MAYDKVSRQLDGDPLRILVLTRQFPRDGNPTAGIFILRQIQSLMRNGVEVRVISPIPWIPRGAGLLGRSHRYAQNETVVDIDGVRVYYPRYLRPLLGRNSHAVTPYFLEAAVRSILNNILEEFRPHLIHAHWAIPEGYAGVRLGKRFGLPTVVSLLGSDINIEPMKSRWVLRNVKWTLRNADQITAVSGAIKRRAESIDGPRKEITVIYNGCDTEVYTFDPEARGRLRGGLGISSGEVVIIFIGSLIRTKGVYEMLQALQLSIQNGRSIRLVVAGDGKEKGKLKKLAASLGVSHLISFLGQIPHSQVAKWLSAADILVLPSYNEGLPNVVMEAMSCGLPVIATEVGGIPEAVEDGLSGILIPPREVAPLVQAVDRLVLDPERRRQMGLRGKEIVESKFKWDNTAAKFKEIFQSLLDE